VANAAVPRARREESFELPEETVRRAAVPKLPRQSWLLALFWTLFAVVLIGFLLFGSVRIGAGNWAGRQMRTTLIWQRFVSFLQEQGASAPVISVVVLMLAVAVIGGVCLVWLAARVQDQHADSVPEPTSDS
jgi:hypothetical protein